MSEQTGGLRRATEAEILAERVANPMDLWFQEYLDLEPAVVARAARRLWGPPAAGGTPGESLWRLWSQRLDVPAYIAVGLLPPAVLFGDGNLPDDDEAERLRDEIRGLLLEAGNR